MTIYIIYNENFKNLNMTFFVSASSLREDCSPIKSVHVSAERLRMMFKVRRTLRSGRKGSEWQGKRKLSMRGMAKDPLLIIKWAAVRQRCAEGEAPSIVGGLSW